MYEESFIGLLLKAIQIIPLYIDFGKRNTALPGARGVRIVFIPISESGHVYHMSLEPQISHFINFTL